MEMIILMNKKGCPLDSPFSLLVTQVLFHNLRTQAHEQKRYFCDGVTSAIVPDDSVAPRGEWLSILDSYIDN